MSSGFVTAGAGENPPPEDDAWRQAREAVEATRKRKEDDAKQGNDGKSLYDILQQNKAAKQEAFEESIRLKNQFRTLDEDEVEFLDSVLESTREKEQALKKETQSQLEAFRKRQGQADQEGDAEGDSGRPLEVTEIQASPTEDTVWKAAPKKRKRVLDAQSGTSAKIRKPSTGTEASEVQVHAAPRPGSRGGGFGKEADHDRSSKSEAPASNVATTNALGLSAYSSDDD